MTDPKEIANPQLYRKIPGEVSELDTFVPTWPTPKEPIQMTKQEKAWAGLIIGMVGTTILITAGFIDDPKLKAILFAVGGLVNTLGVKLGVFQVANSEAKL